jgi:hypothetical protein
MLLFLLGFLRSLDFLSVFCAPGWVPVLVRFLRFFVICAGLVSVPWVFVLAACFCLLGVCFRLPLCWLGGCCRSFSVLLGCLFLLAFCFRGYIIRWFNLFCMNYMFSSVATLFIEMIAVRQGLNSRCQWIEVYQVSTLTTSLLLYSSHTFYLLRGLQLLTASDHSVCSFPTLSIPSWNLK